MTRGGSENGPVRFKIRTFYHQMSVRVFRVFVFLSETFCVQFLEFILFVVAASAGPLPVQFMSWCDLRRPLWSRFSSYSKLSRMGSCPVSLRKRSRSSGRSPMVAALVMGWKWTIWWPPSTRSRSRTNFTLRSSSKSRARAVAQP